jgi:hypothetical protein
MTVAQMQNGCYDSGMAAVSDTLRAALERCGQTHSQVSRATGIAPSVLSRFARGQPLRGENLDRLCDHLGLRLTGAGKPTRARRRKAR